MERRLAVAALVGLVLAGCFAAAAWATHTLGYGPAGKVLSAGYGYADGYTSGWTQNYMKWTDPDGGTPNMCSNYENSSGDKILTDKCSGSGIEDDAHCVSSYSAPVCWASNANNYPVKLSDAWDGWGCWATHN